MHFLVSHGAPQETAEYAIKVAKGKGDMDPECSDPTYIIVGWCAMPIIPTRPCWDDVRGHTF